MSAGTPADFVYNNARTMFATAALNWTTAAINAMFVSSDYAPLLTDQYVSDIPASAIILRDYALTNLGVKDGVCYGVVPEITGILSAYTVTAMVLYAKGATDAASPLIYYTSSGYGFPFPVQGFDYYVGFDQANGGFFQV